MRRLIVVVLLALAALPSVAVADPVMDDSTSEHPGFRWGPGEPGERWVQFDDRVHKYDCQWIDSGSAWCRDREGGDYVCHYSGPAYNKFFCSPNNAFGLAGTQSGATLLSTGIANRGQVSRPPPAPAEVPSDEDPPC